MRLSPRAGPNGRVARATPSSSPGPAPRRSVAVVDRRSTAPRRGAGTEMGTTMELTFEKVLEAFDAALELVEDPEQRTRLARVIQASQPSVERATQDLVAELVEEIST